MSRITIFLLVLLLVCRNAFGAYVDIEADTVEKTGDMIEATGKVHVKGEDMSLNADYVFYNGLTGDLWASGNCHLVETRGELDAAILYYNMIRKDVHVFKGSVLLYKGPVKISGEDITRYGPDLYTGKDVKYTTCLGEPPAWAMHAGSLYVPLEGYARARDVSFVLDKIPVLYTPYFLYPAKLKRQSGLLFPEYGHSDRKGYSFSLPVYLATSRSTDVTITPDYLSSRGLLMAGEFRYRPSYTTSGEIYLEAIHDKKGGEKQDWGILDKVPTDRWFLKARHTGTDLKWDINLVSDEDYLNDIGTLYKGRISSEWESTSTRDLEELVSRAEWTKSVNGFTLGIYGRWKQDLTVKGDDKTMQELPTIMGRMAQRNIPHTPIECSADIESTRFYTEKWVRGLKDYADVEFTMPVNLKQYLTIRPWIDEIYRDTDFTRRCGAFDKNRYKEHWQERGVSLSTTLYSKRTKSGWYHQVVPDVSFEYKSRYNGNYDSSDTSDTYPDLMSGDAWAKEYDMRLSVANYIRDSNGNAVIEFDVDRTYSYITEDWGLVNATMIFRPCTWFSLEHRNSFGRVSSSPYATQEHWTTMSIKDSRGDKLSFSEEYNRQDTNSTEVNISANLLKGFSATLDARYDHLKHRYEYFRHGIKYTSQCWSITLLREVESSDDTYPRDSTIYLTVNFLGLGDVIKTSH